MGLTAKRRAFADFYLITYGNGAEAARRAGYSEKTARQQASKLLKDPAVNRYIVENFARAAAARGLEVEEIAEQLRRLSFADITDVLSWNTDGKVSIIPSDELPVETRAAIKSVMEIVTESTTKDGRKITTRRFKLLMHDKNPTLRTAAQHLGMLEHGRERELDKVPLEVWRRMIAGDGDDNGKKK